MLGKPFKKKKKNGVQVNWTQNGYTGINYCQP